MTDLLIVALAGFAASMVDGALGMGFGPTSAAILLGAGLPPTASSASINIAKVVTGLASAGAHMRAGNVNRRLALRLALPGALGAALGAVVLLSVDPTVLRPVLAVLLLLVGVRILIRFGLEDGSQPPRRDDQDAELLVQDADPPRGTGAAGAFGGFTNGLVGAWGPVVTPFLLHHGVAPRVAVGSVNTAEVAVAVVSVGTLLGASGGAEGLDLGIIGAMLLGGVAAAPLAARLVRRVPARSLGLAVAGLLLLTQTRELAAAVDTPLSRWLGYGIVSLAVAVAATRPLARVRRRVRQSA